MAELESHSCPDRQAGLLSVPNDHNAILYRMLLFWEAANGHKHGDHKSDSYQKTMNQLEDATSSGSEDEGFREETDGMALMRSGRSAPVAYQSRGDLIKKGMFVATLPSPDDEGGWMSGHPFLIAKVTRVTKKYFWLHYYGDQFLGVYRALTDNEGDDWICKYERGSITILHWNIKLTGSYKGGGGKLSAGDQRVLGFDTRVLWEYSPSKKRSECSGAVVSNTSKKKRKKNR